MKVLIAYDGSLCANDALRDLKNAGLPVKTEALILTVTENWALILEEWQHDFADDELEYSDSDALKRMHENALKNLARAIELAKSAATRVQTEFPRWRVRHEALADFTVRGILQKAAKWQPDLIIVGSHGRNLLGRAVLGSVSLKILSEAQCSVRVARRSRARTEDDDSPQRIIIGIDGSYDSMLAVDAVARRSWRQDSAVRLVTAVESVLSPISETELQQAEDLRAFAAHKLEAAGLHVSKTVREGDAKNILVQEAEKWGADAVFLGARGHRLMERIMFGSISYAAAARAGCSVEVIREKGVNAD